MSLHTAIGQATSAAGQPEPSVFAGLRRAAGLLTRMISYLEKAESLTLSSGSPGPITERG